MNNDWIQWGPHCRVRADEIVGVHSHTVRGSHWSWAKVTLCLANQQEYTAVAGSWNSKIKEAPADVLEEVERLMDLATDSYRHSTQE